MLSFCGTFDERCLNAQIVLCCTLHAQTGSITYRLGEMTKYFGKKDFSPLTDAAVCIILENKAKGFG